MTYQVNIRQLQCVYINSRAIIEMIRGLPSGLSEYHAEEALPGTCCELAKQCSPQAWYLSHPCDKFWLLVWTEDESQMLKAHAMVA